MTDERRRIDEFVEAATTFRELCDNAEELGCARVLSRLARVLPRLQATAAALPDAHPESDRLPFEADERERKTLPDAFERCLPTDWAEVQANLHKTVGGGGESMATALLLDDLGDVYDEVTEGFDILDAGFPEEEAVWHWRLGFWTHWGNHLAEAQRLIHYHVALNALHAE